MKQLSGLTIALFACIGLAITAVAGPEALPSGKEMKEVAPLPPPPSCCNWTGFYLGLHAGGQFGHSEDKDLDYWDYPDQPWGYSESGFVGGGQAGYNFQWRWLVLGPEFDAGYMNLNGRGLQKGTPSLIQTPDYGSSDSDFYTTFRGRIGVAYDCWLFYGTAGGIGVNYETRDTQSYPAMVPSGTFDFDANKQAFDWGYTVGGGIERKIGCHWSLKVEYLYFALGTQRFSGLDDRESRYRFDAETAGHIVRGGLNYHF